MRQWNLPFDPNFSLPLAADARCGVVSYTDDQIWELNCGGGDPPAVAVRTTFGLRARAMRLFPRFHQNDQTVCDPGEFYRSPVLRNFYPNYARLELSPFSGIDVNAEVWVPQSQAILGRLQFTNQSEARQLLRLEWVGALTPDEGQRMAAEQIQACHVLCGRTQDLYPLVFLTGGAQPGRGPYPSLVLEVDLEEGETKALTWCHAALNSHQASFDLARSLSAQPWEAHIARLELVNAGQVEVYTGIADWDFTFAFSQAIAHQLFCGPTASLPFPSFTLTRHPDQGYSPRGDGSDYSHLWSGQSPQEAYALADLLLPGSAELLQGVLRNYLAVQAEDGFIDWKPGLAGQRSRLLAAPLLASLAWRIYQASLDRTFLEEAFPGLLRFVVAWFALQHDRDQDGLPEWDHPVQSGYADHPTFSSWHAWSQGVEINTAESPALGALLFSELDALLQASRLLGDSAAVKLISGLAERLREQVEATWDEGQASYLYRDRDSHLAPVAEALGERQGPGQILVGRIFDPPVRLLVRIDAHGETRPHPCIFIHGESASGQHRVERIEDDQLRWSLGEGSLTGTRVYSSIERVEFKDLLPADQVSLATAGYDCQDHTLLLPLWAGIPRQERAERLVEGTITNPEKYWREFGLPACPQAAPEADTPGGQVHLWVNYLVCAGLLRAGYRSEAEELFSRLMAGILQNLKEDGSLRPVLDSRDGAGSGERNALGGLAPLGLFLEVLGVRVHSRKRVHLQGINPFPWPVTVKYRGLTVLRRKENTVVIFPDGQTVEVSDPKPRLINLEI